MNFGFVIFLIASAMLLPAEAYRILGVFPFNGKSHFVMFGALMRELAARGHQVDVIGHHPLKKPLPNYTDVVDLSGTVFSFVNNMTFEFGTTALTEDTFAMKIATRFGSDLCDLMDQPQFRKFIQNPPQDPPYDVVIVEVFGANCYSALGNHLKVPMVGVITSPVWPWTNDVIGNPDNSAYIPHSLSGMSGKMNFWQRLRNTWTLLRSKWQFNHYSAYQNEKIKKYFGPDAPNLSEVERNISLILVNSHYSLHGVRPFTTAVVEVGGLHVKEDATPLPTDLQKWLDDSKDGFVFISFGSQLKLESFPKKVLSALYSSLNKLAPVRALIKIVNEDELPPGLPSNVMTLPWIPQLPVLQHKNIRAFVTHGGLMGTQEAIYCGVPMIGVPIFGDQTQNIELYEKKHIAIHLSLSELSEKNLDSAFNAILHDPSYTESSKKMSSEFRDRPMTAADTAVYWVEYVIRHGGTNIRSPALDLTWWQIALLDVYGALALASALVIFLLKFIIFKIMGTVSQSSVERPSVFTKKNK